MRYIHSRQKNGEFSVSIHNRDIFNLYYLSYESNRDRKSR